MSTFIWRGRHMLGEINRRNLKKNNIQIIKKSNDKFQIIKSLKQNRKKRNTCKEIFIEGIESIKQAISANVFVKKVIFADYNNLSNWGKEIIRKINYEELIQLENGLYNDLSDKSDPSELIITIKYEKIAIDDIELNQNPFILIFDRPSDKGNLGSIIRSANSFGVNVIITTGHGVDIYNPKVIRASLGAVFHTKILHIENIIDLELWLKKVKQKYKINIVCTDSTGDISIMNPLLKRPIALILGNEAKGISLRFQQISDKIVSIPMQGKVNSLNVACAGSIFLWQIASNSYA